MLARSFIKSGNINIPSISDYSTSLCRDTGTGKLTLLKLTENRASPETPFMSLTGVVIDVFIDGNSNPISLPYANEQIETNIAFSSSLEIYFRTTEGFNPVSVNFFITYTKIIQPDENSATLTSQELAPMPDQTFESYSCSGKRIGFAALHDTAQQTVHITQGRNELNGTSFNLLSYDLNTNTWANDWLWDLTTQMPLNPQPWVGSWLVKNNNSLLSFGSMFYEYDLVQQNFIGNSFTQPLPSSLMLSNFQVTGNAFDDFSTKGVKVCCTMFSADTHLGYTSTFEAELFLIKTASDIYAQLYSMHTGTPDVLDSANLTFADGIYSGDISFLDETYMLKGTLHIEVYDLDSQLALNDKIDRMVLTRFDTTMWPYPGNKIAMSNPYYYNNKTYFLLSGGFQNPMIGELQATTLIAYNHAFAQFEAVIPTTNANTVVPPTFPQIPLNLKISDYTAINTAGASQAGNSLASFILPMYAMCGENEYIYIVTSTGISSFNLITKEFVATLPGSAYAYGHGTYTAIQNGKIYIVNGYDRQRGLLQRVLVYDIGSQNLADITADYVSLPPRSAHGFATIYNNEMYLFGGLNNGVSNDVWKIELPSVA